MPTIEEIRKELKLQPVIQKEASLQKKASGDSLATEIDTYLQSQTLGVFIDQIEKEAGVSVPDKVKQFIATASQDGHSEEEIINFIKEKYNAK